MLKVLLGTREQAQWDLSKFWAQELEGTDLNFVFTYHLAFILCERKLI